MKTPTINSRILKLEVLKGTATRTSVNAVEARTTSLESDVATAQSDISTLQTDVSTAEGNISTLQGNVATLTQGIVDAVSTHNTAPDSHADIRADLAGKQDSLTISNVGEAMLALATPSGQKIPRVNADGSVVLINVPSGDGVGGSSWYASDDGPPVGARTWVSNGDTNGVVYLAGVTYGGGTFTNPCAAGGPMVILRSSNGDGNAQQLTDRQTNVSYSANIPGSWVCIDLGVYALLLESYSLQHQSTYAVDYIRTWRLQGTNTISEWSSSGVEAASWTDLDVRSGDTTIAAVSQWGHWVCNQSPSQAYRYLRLLQDGANSEGRYYLTTAEMEFYGSLSITTPPPGAAAGWARNTELIDDATAWMPYYATSALTDGTPIFGTAYDVAAAVSAHNVAGDSHADIRTALAGKQAAGSYLTTTGTAADSSKLGGVAASGYSQTSHTHNYAGSSSPGGAATTALACTGNAATATKLATARTLTIGATGKTFDGSSNVTWTLSEIGAVAQETGTWSPGFSAVTAPTGVTYSSLPTGKYVKTGVSCTIEFWIEMTSKGAGGSGHALFTGLPFTAYNSTRFVQWKGPVGYIFRLTDQTDSYKLAWGVRDNDTICYLGRNGGGYYTMQWSDLTDTTTSYGSFTYRTSS